MSKCSHDHPARFVIAPAFISNSRSSVTQRPLVIHNIGQGTQEDDILTAFEIDGHFAFWG
jgi:uncharacterized protein YijF (DUF1287 family)